MVATEEFVRERIAQFNDLCFEGKLPDIPIKLSHARTFLGKLEYTKVRGLFGRTISCGDYRIKISTSYDLPENELVDVIIHELIHYHIALGGRPDSSAHGRLFREEMKRINSEFGRNITISHKNYSGLVETKQNPRILCVSTFTDGTRGLTVCASTKVKEIRRKLPRYYRLRSMEWFESDDAFFRRFPRSVTPKIYKVSPTELSEHLECARPLDI